MYYSEKFKQKIGEPVSGGTVRLGTINKIGEWLTDTQITQKFNIEPMSIPDFWATIGGVVGVFDKIVWGCVFCVKAEDGCALTVFAYWSDRQWLFYCFEFDGRGEWLAERCVFSPAIALEPSTPSLSEPLPLTEEQMISALKSKGYTISKTF